MKNKLSRQKYLYIQYKTRKFLLENKINVLPTNLNQIANNMGWKVVPYSKLLTLNVEKFIQISKKTTGFSVLLPSGQYVIFYNDCISETAQRFTIAHEMGHIALRHFTKNQKNRETQANIFAAKLLMPDCILNECNINSKNQIKTICNVNTNFARNMFFKLQKTKNNPITNIEYKLKKQFKNFINSI